MVCSYYWIEGSVSLFDQIAAYKANGGLVFTAVTTIISGGLLPELLKRGMRPRGEAQPKMIELLHQFTMWGILGIMIDLFYRLQTELFGQTNDAGTLLIKVLFDLFCFTPLLSLPFIASWFLLYEKQGKLLPWLRALTFVNIYKRVLPLWVTALCFWPAMLLVVYSLPSQLQFPLFLFGNSAYSILMIFIARRQKEEASKTVLTR